MNIWVISELISIDCLSLKMGHIFFHMLSNSGLYLRYWECYVAETEFYYIPLKAIDFCYTRQVIWLESNCRFHLLGGSSNLSWVPLSLFGVCPVHMWFKDQAEFIHRIWPPSFLVFSSPGFPVAIFLRLAFIYENHGKSPNFPFCFPLMNTQWKQIKGRKTQG